MSDKVLGLDLNHYRPDVPLKTAKAQGVRFIIGKCSEGLTYVDPTYHAYKERSKNYRLPFGGYLYWRYIFDPIAQAKFFVKTLGTTEFRPIVDVERINNTKAGSKTAPIVSINANRRHLLTVLETIEADTGVKPMVYTNWATWRHLFGDWDIFGENGYELWVANWRLYGEPLLPVPAEDWKLHQFTSIYKVAGYYKGVDANWFNGNEAEFESYIAEIDQLWNPSDQPEKGQFVTVSILKGDNEQLFVLTEPNDSVVVRLEEL